MLWLGLGLVACWIMVVVFEDWRRPELTIRRTGTIVFGIIFRRACNAAIAIKVRSSWLSWQWNAVRHNEHLNDFIVVV